MPTPEPTYTFPSDVIETAELALSALLPLDDEQVAKAVRIALSIAAATVDQVIADADDMISASMGANALFAQRQTESDEILAEARDWYARTQAAGEYSSKLTDLGRLLTPGAQHQVQLAEVVGDDYDARSIVDKFIIEFDANAGLSAALNSSTAALSEVAAVIDSDRTIPAPAKVKLQRIIQSSPAASAGTSADNWDALAAARAGAVAHIEFLIDGLGDLRGAIQKWRDEDFAAAIPDIDRDVHVVLAQLVHDLDHTHFTADDTADVAMGYIRGELLPAYRRVTLRR